MADAARARAGEIDEQVGRDEDPGPLAGVPIALKDNIEVAGVPMTAANGFMRDHIAPSDAPVTTGLRRAGAVILGTLHMSEWAIGGTTQNIHFGVGHNPWDPARVPGGSSGGSGAAIAADLALATLGTDTGGLDPVAGIALRRGGTAADQGPGQQPRLGAGRLFV
jgi:aspartyl-tRNA(Asn)/glutamyl-tRNA(Gln) amidotransferase subunit A